jgi:hypothetical protein
VDAEFYYCGTIDINFMMDITWCLSNDTLKGFVTLAGSFIVKGVSLASHHWHHSQFVMPIELNISVFLFA